jgi:hypothetical protein
MLRMMDVDGYGDSLDRKSARRRMQEAQPYFLAFFFAAFFAGFAAAFFAEAFFAGPFFAAVLPPKT